MCYGGIFASGILECARQYYAQARTCKLIRICLWFTIPKKEQKPIRTCLGGSWGQSNDKLWRCLQSAALPELQMHSRKGCICQFVSNPGYTILTAFHASRNKET